MQIRVNRQQPVQENEYMYRAHYNKTISIPKNDTEIFITNNSTCRLYTTHADMPTLRKVFRSKYYQMGIFITNVCSMLWC